MCLSGSERDGSRSVGDSSSFHIRLWFPRNPSTESLPPNPHHILRGYRAGLGWINQRHSSQVFQWQARENRGLCMRQKQRAEGSPGMLPREDKNGYLNHPQARRRVKVRSGQRQRTSSGCPPRESWVWSTVAPSRDVDEDGELTVTVVAHWQHGGRVTAL